MYKLRLVGIYEIGFLKADFDHEPGFILLLSFCCVAHLYVGNPIQQLEPTLTTSISSI